jgi:hypothetical protein
MRIGNDLVGKFKGIPVYKSNMVDFVNNRHYYNEDNIFLINGELIYKNEIFAKYDGNYVTEYDPHQRATYYTIPAIKVDKRGVEFTSSIGTDEGDSYSNSETETEYTAVVSNFQPEDVEATLSGVYETDYFSSMTDIDAFLKANS